MQCDGFACFILAHAVVVGLSPEAGLVESLQSHGSARDRESCRLALRRSREWVGTGSPKVPAMPQVLLWQDALPFPWYVVNRINSFLVKVEINVKEESEGEGPVLQQQPAEVAERSLRPSRKKPFKGRYAGQRRDTASQIKLLQSSSTLDFMIDRTRFGRVCQDVLHEVSMTLQPEPMPKRRLRQKCSIKRVGRLRLREKTPPAFKLSRAATKTLQFAAESFLTGRLVKAGCLAKMAKDKTVDIKHTQMVDNLYRIDREPLTSPLVQEKRKRRRQ